MCVGEMLLIFGTFKGLPRLAPLNEAAQALFVAYSVVFFAIGIIIVMHGARITSLDSQTKISETFANVEGEISELTAKLDAKK